MPTRALGSVLGEHPPTTALGGPRPHPRTLPQDPHPPPSLNVTCKPLHATHTQPGPFDLELTTAARHCGIGTSDVSDPRGARHVGRTARGVTGALGVVVASAETGTARGTGLQSGAAVGGPTTAGAGNGLGAARRRQFYPEKHIATKYTYV